MNKIQISGSIKSVRSVSEKLQIISLDSGKGTFQIKLFNDYGRNLLPKLTEGIRITVNGELTQSRFVAQDGTEVSRTDIIGRRVKLNTEEEVNEITIQGRIVREVENRFTSTGEHNVSRTALGVVDFRDEEHFFTVEGWDEVAQEMLTLEKGQEVLIKGSLRKNVWESKEGELRSQIYINLLNFSLVGVPVAPVEG